MRPLMLDNQALRFWQYALTLAALVPLFALDAHANKLGVWPIDPVMEFEAKASQLKVNNLDPTHPTRIQASVLAWYQDGTRDIYSEQDTIVISPPQIEIKPGQEQLFRIILRQPLDASQQQRAYRILLEEVPSNTTPKAAGSAIKITMKYSLPLIIEYEKNPTSFKKRADTVEKSVSYRVSQSPNPNVQITNQSPWVQRFSQVQIVNGSGAVLNTVSNGLWGYALPGSARQFPLDNAQYQLLQKADNRLVYTYSKQEYRIAPSH